MHCTLARARDQHYCEEKAECVLLCALKLKAGSIYAHTGCIALYIIHA